MFSGPLEKIPILVYIILGQSTSLGHSVTGHAVYISTSISTKVYPRYVFLDKRVVIYLLIHIKFLYKVKENSSRFHISPFYRNHILSVMLYCF